MSIEDKVYKLLEKKVEPFRTKIERREREQQRLKTASEVFDESTMLTLYSLLSRGKLDMVEGNLSSGKEANVFLARDPDGKYVAIKIYRIHTTSFRNLTPYISGDPRFKVLPRDHRSLVFTWAKKEYKNLVRLGRAGVRVPRPLHHLKNILVMEYIGDETTPARTLKDSPTGDPAELGDWALGNIEAMVLRAGLVHSDMSEFNVLVHPGTGERVIIDVAQSVVLDHPRAPEFLVRDIRNVIRYLTRLGADVDLDPEEHARALLARSRKRPGDALAGRNGPDAAGPGPDGDGEGEDGAPSRHTN